MKAINIFKAKNLSNLDVQKDKLLLNVDGEIHEFSYDDITPLEALLLRMNSKVEMLVDTSTVFEEKKNE